MYRINNTNDHPDWDLLILLAISVSWTRRYQQAQRPFAR
jgi:hypothetical protein